MKHFSKGALALLAVLVLFVRCSKDDDGGSGETRTVQFEITDGPTDDANVKAVFVTVAAVKVDGETLSGFTKQTIDLASYQQGSTKVLGTAELEAGKSYDDVSLVLDFETDASGNSPGSYVLTTGNVKHSLQAGSDATAEIKVGSGEFEVPEDSSAAATVVVLDFNLRKAVRYEDATATSDDYDFVTDSELRASVRMVAKAQTGTVSGSADDNLGLAGDKIVVCAYEKGEFDKEDETQGQGDSDVLFKNAVTSAAVDAQGNYTLAFLKEGDYELHFFGYEDADGDGRLDIMGELQLTVVGGLLDLTNVSVDAKGTVSLNVLVTGLLP